MYPGSQVPSLAPHLADRCLPSGCPPCCAQVTHETTPQMMSEAQVHSGLHPRGQRKPDPRPGQASQTTVSSLCLVAAAAWAQVSRFTSPTSGGGSREALSGPGPGGAACTRVPKLRPACPRQAKPRRDAAARRAGQRPPGLSSRRAGHGARRPRRSPAPPVRPPLGPGPAPSRPPSRPPGQRGQLGRASAAPGPRGLT